MPMKFNDFTVCFYYCIRSTVVGEEVSDGCVLHIVNDKHYQRHA